LRLKARQQLILKWLHQMQFYGTHSIWLSAVSGYVWTAEEIIGEGEITMLQLLATWSWGTQVQVNIQVQAMQRKSSLPTSCPTESTG